MAPSIPRKLGSRIRRLRQAAGWTQADLAEDIGVTDEYISKIERGKGNPSLEVIAGIAEAFGVTLRELFDFDAGVPSMRPDLRYQRLRRTLKNASDVDVELISRIAEQVVRYGKP